MSESSPIHPHAAEIAGAATLIENADLFTDGVASTILQHHTNDGIGYVGDKRHVSADATLVDDSGRQYTLNCDWVDDKILNARVRVGTVPGDPEQGATVYTLRQEPSGKGETHTDSPMECLVAGEDGGLPSLLTLSYRFEPDYRQSFEQHTPYVERPQQPLPRESIEGLLADLSRPEMHRIPSTL